MSRATAPDSEALQAAQQGAALFDHSDYGRLEIAGAGSLDFLHSQTTNAIKHLQPSEGCDTVFVTPTAGILDLASVYCLGPDQALILTSPERQRQIVQTLTRFILFLPAVTLTDWGETTVAYTLTGSQSRTLLTQLGWQDVATAQPWRQYICLMPDSGLPIQVLTGSDADTLTLIAAKSEGDPLWELLLRWGGIPASAQVWSTVCLWRGRPLPDLELTEQINPLEAGLWHAISLSKGCYVGQEVLAKQVTYGRIRQFLWGIRLPVPVAAGSPVLVGGERMGSITRSALWGDAALGLAFIRARAQPCAGLPVQVEEYAGELVRLPYLQYPPTEAEL